MKLRYSLSLPLLVMSMITFGQSMPIDFSDSNENFLAFSGSSFSFNTDPQDDSNPVGQFFNDGSNATQGFYLDVNQTIDLSEEQLLTLAFYAFDPNSHNIVLKLENGSDPDVQVKEIITSPSASNWITVTFDFSNAQNSVNGSNVNALGTYNRITVFIDEGDLTPGTYLIDDINNGSEAVDPNILDVIYTDLVWEDNFDIDGAIDPNNWFHQTQLPTSGNGSWFNGEQQHYTNRIENSYVENGFLNIKAINETYTDQGQTKQYTSARLNSKFAFTYGRVDVRAKLPFGDGTWPAIWTLGKNINEDGGYWDNEFGTVNWPASGEIDIMEHGLGAVNNVSSALHSPCNGCFGNTMNVQYYSLTDVANNFHVYSMNWSPNQITFLIDGVGFYTYNPAIKDSGTWPFDDDQYLLLNVAMGGIAGTIDPNFVESSMVIDYVRVYQNTLNVNGALDRTFIISPNPTSNHVTISSEKKIDAVELYDVLGNLVLRKVQDLSQIGLDALSAGIYILKIFSEQSTSIKRLIKE